MRRHRRRRRKPKASNMDRVRPHTQTHTRLMHSAANQPHTLKSCCQTITPDCFSHVSFLFPQLFYCYYLQSSSFSSITDSTMSLNIITVTLNMGEWSGSCTQKANRCKCKKIKPPYTESELKKFAQGKYARAHFFPLVLQVIIFSVFPNFMAASHPC